MTDKLSHQGAAEGRFRQGIIIASGDYKSADPAAVTVDTHGADTVRVNTNVTAISGSGATVTVLVEGENPDGTWYTLLSKAITTAGVTSQNIGPEIASSAGIGANVPVPKRCRVTCTGSGTRTTLTYDVSAEIN